MSHAADTPRGVHERISRASGATGAGGKAVDPASGSALIDVAQTLANGVGAARRGESAVLGGRQKSLTEGEEEPRGLRRALAEVTMERDILKKAAAYFAKASLPGTR